MDDTKQRQFVPKLLIEPALLLRLNHELRTPLTAIKGFTGLLRRYPLRFTLSEQREMLDEILVGCARLEAAIAQVVTVSERAAGTSLLMPEVIDLAHLVRQVVVTASESAPLNTAPRWQYVVTIPPDDVMPVAGDARELTQVLEHILKNARHSSPDGGTIAVTLQRWHEPAANAITEDRPVRWELRVRDSGVRRSAEHLHQLAQRGDGDDVTYGFAGRELGLLYCKLIAALYGGQLWVESPSQPGTTLHFLLPSANTDDL